MGAEAVMESASSAILVERSWGEVVLGIAARAPRNWRTDSAVAISSGVRIAAPLPSGEMILGMEPGRTMARAAGGGEGAPSLVGLDGGDLVEEGDEVDRGVLDLLVEGLGRLWGRNVGQGLVVREHR